MLVIPPVFLLPRLGNFAYCPPGRWRVAATEFPGKLGETWRVDHPATCPRIQPSHQGVSHVSSFCPAFSDCHARRQQLRRLRLRHAAQPDGAKGERIWASLASPLDPAPLLMAAGWPRIGNCTAGISLRATGRAVSGMGTGMPNWGTIYSEDELWAVMDFFGGLSI